MTPSVWETLTVVKKGSTIANMGTRAVEKGAVSETVRGNIQRLRAAQGLSLEALSARLGEVGRPILKSGLSKLEQGERRVDVDDLAALAVALNVNLSALMLPDLAGDEPVQITPAVEVPAWAAWQWADGYMPLPTRPGDDPDEPYNTAEEVEAFQQLARPGAIRRTEQHPAMRAAVQVAHRMRRVIYQATKQPLAGRDRPDLGLETTLRLARRAVERVSSELEDLEEEASRGQR